MDHFCVQSHMFGKQPHKEPKMDICTILKIVIIDFHKEQKSLTIKEILLTSIGARLIR